MIQDARSRRSRRNTPLGGDYDVRLRSRIEAAMRESGYFALLDFTVRVRDRLASLEGRVPSSFYRSLACELASSVDGVEAVRSKLRIG